MHDDVGLVIVLSKSQADSTRLGWGKNTAVELKLELGVWSFKLFNTALRIEDGYLVLALISCEV